MLGVQLHQVSALANLSHRQTSELTTYKTKTYASCYTIANCCAVRDQDHCQLLRRPRPSPAPTPSRPRPSRGAVPLRPRRSPEKGEEKTATSAQLTVLSVLP